MKYYDTHYEEYINSYNNYILHNKTEKIIKKLPNNIKLLKNIILYGSTGIGKYTQALNIIKKYSPSELKYEKKIGIIYNKESYYIKISDIHYEIDMSLLGVNSKLLWNEIYLHIVDIITSKNEKYGIILCKNFNEIQIELLENFYSYIQQDKYSIINIQFIILTEQLSFIPDNILKACYIIHYAKPNKKSYIKLIKNKNINNIKNIKNNDIDIDKLINIKTLYNNIEYINHYDNICNKIITEIINKEINLLKFRDIIYDIFTYNLDISICIWNILNILINKNKIKNISNIVIKTYQFFQYYNNNYRALSHVEKYFLYIMTNIDV